MAGAEQAFNTQQAAAVALANPPKEGNSRQSVLDRLLSTSDKLGQKGPRGLEIQQEEGVFAKKQAAKDLENGIISKTRAYDKQIEQIRANPTGKLAGAVEADIANIERQKNSELADLRIQQKVANDDYAGAFEIAQAKVNAEFEPLQNEVDTLKTYYQLSADDMTESEKMQAQAAIQKKEAEVAFGREKELAKYKAEIEQSSPLYQAQVAAANRSNQGGGVGGKAVSSATALNLADSQAAIDMLSTLEGEITGKKNLFGPVRGFFGGSNPYDTSSQGVQSTINATKQIVGKYLEGGVLRAEDEKKYEKILPTLRDTPQVAATKLANVRALVMSKVAAQQSTLTAAGYNPAIPASDVFEAPDGSEWEMI
jgi:hypothetical protein